MKLLPCLLGAISSFSIENNAELKEPMNLARSNVREIGWDILFREDTSKNSAISPLSLVGAMYMLAAGTAGETQREILDVLNFQEDNDPETPFKAYSRLVDGVVNDGDGYTLNIANAAFHQEDTLNGEEGEIALRKYSGVLTEDFMQKVVTIQPVNFLEDSEAATQMINTWANETTRGKISEIFTEPLDPDTLMVLASSLYFKASWNKKFELEKPFKTCWAGSLDNIILGTCNDEVQFMTRTGTFGYYKDAATKIEVFEISMEPSKNADGVMNRFTMLIYDNDGGFTDPESDLKMQKFIKENEGSIRSKLHNKRMRLVLPMFNIEQKINLVETLKSLGINKIFSSGDFSPMLGDGVDATVSKINHAVNLNVDKDGIEGAAVTAISISFRSGGAPEKKEIDTPFYYSISNRVYDTKGKNGIDPSLNRNVPIFIGKVVNPVPGKK